MCVCVCAYVCVCVCVCINGCFNGNEVGHYPGGGGGYSVQMTIRGRAPPPGGGGGATDIERWTPCSFKKTRKKGRFSRTGDVRAYSGRGIKIAEIWEKG